MVRMLPSLTVFILLLASSAVNAQQRDPRIALDEYAAGYELAQITATIKSPYDLNRVIRNTNTGPLRHLSRPAQLRFARSLTFNERGVTGFSYEDIERELSVSQAFELLASIGQQHFLPRLGGLRVESELDEMLLEGRVPGIGGANKCLTPSLPVINGNSEVACDGFLKDYRCTGPGNCGEALRNACTSHC